MIENEERLVRKHELFSVVAVVESTGVQEEKMV